jgi:hypothetical protein
MKPSQLPKASHGLKAKVLAATLVGPVIEFEDTANNHRDAKSEQALAEKCGKDPGDVKVPGSLNQSLSEMKINSRSKLPQRPVSRPTYAAIPPACKKFSITHSTGGC